MNIVSSPLTKLHPNNELCLYWINSLIVLVNSRNYVTMNLKMNWKSTRIELQGNSMIPQLSNCSLTCRVRTILSRVVFCSGSRSWDPPCSMRMISEHASSSVLREGWGLSPPFSITSNSSSSHLVLVSFSCETFVFVMTTCPASERNFFFLKIVILLRLFTSICSFHCLRYTSSDVTVSNQWWLVSHGILVWKSNNLFELRKKHKYQRLMNMPLYMYSARQMGHTLHTKIRVNRFRVM